MSSWGHDLLIKQEVTSYGYVLLDLGDAPSQRGIFYLVKLKKVLERVEKKNS